MNVPKPLNDHVVVKPLGGATVTKGGIHIPETAQKRANRGEVLAVGPGAPLTPHEAHIMSPHKREECPRMPMSLKAGDIVYFSSYGGNEIELADGGNLLFFRENEILGVESTKEERGE